MKIYFNKIQREGIVCFFLFLLQQLSSFLLYFLINLFERIWLSFVKQLTLSVNRPLRFQTLMGHIQPKQRTNPVHQQEMLEFETAVQNNCML